MSNVEKMKLAFKQNVSQLFGLDTGIYINFAKNSFMNNTKRKKDSWLLVRLTAEQKQEIKRAAAVAGCSVSDLVRKQFLTTCA